MEKSFTAKIEETNLEGNGIVKIEGCVVFVLGAVKGDVVHAEITTEKKNFKIAKITEIIASRIGKTIEIKFVMKEQIKEQGTPVVGAYCTYLPKEIAMAAGAATVGLCSTSDETIAEAEKDLPKTLCPLIKSSYGFAKTKRRSG